MPKRLLDVGQCSADHGSIRWLVEREFQAEIERTHGLVDTLERLRGAKFDLVLVNRLMDADGSPGIDIIRELKADPDLSSIPVMLVTNYAEHQAQAIAAGAEPGFGKAQLAASVTRDALAKFLA
jgi:two-component system chemotaxis response regulator CheY